MSSLPSVMKRLVVDDAAYETTFTRKYEQRRPHQPRDHHAVRAYLPGLILAVHVEQGEPLHRGQRLLTLEAMKMQNDLTAPCDGLVVAVHVRPGQQVCKDQVLLDLADPPAATPLT